MIGLELPSSKMLLYYKMKIETINLSNATLGSIIETSAAKNCQVYG